jgi:hypothetical protein
LVDTDGTIATDSVRAPIRHGALPLSLGSPHGKGSTAIRQRTEGWVSGAAGLADPSPGTVPVVSGVSTRWREAFDVVFLIALWTIAAFSHWDGFAIFIAAGWTLRVILFERRGYRLLTRGWSWSPSKDPDRYR